MDVLYDLATFAEGAVVHSGVAALTTMDGRPALRISRPDDVDQATFVALPIWFEDGTIEVDVFSRLDDRAPDSVKPFAGLAYRVRGDRDRSDVVHVRPLNGTWLNPPTTKVRRAAQHFAFPELPFDRLSPRRLSEPGGHVDLESWARLTLHIDGTRLTSLVDGVEALVIPVDRAAALRGDLGLFIGVGTEAYFSSLWITPA